MTALLFHLQRHDVPFLIIGGRGLEAHGYVRNTRDLDLLVPLTSVERINRILSDFGYVRTAETAIFSRWISADPEAEALDLLYVDVSTFSKLDADAVSVSFGESNARVPSVGGMVALKLFAMRNDPGRAPRDTLDIRELLQLHPGAIDLASLRRLCERYGPPDIFEALQPSP